MKISQLIAAAHAALQEHGDIDVCTPCADEGIDEDVTEVHETKCRLRGSPFVEKDKWTSDAQRMVFVIA